METVSKGGGVVILTAPPNKVNDEINALVQKYRDGNSKAGEELYRRFLPLIKKYKSVLWNGRAPAYDRDVGRFLSFFNRDKKKAAELLSKSMIKVGEEDLDQILNYSFYKTLLKYNKVSAGFKFILKDEIAKVTKDVSTHRTTITIDSTDVTLSHLWESPEGRLASIEDKESDMETFVTEGSDLPGFDKLTHIQRLIAKKAFIDGYDNADIAIQLEIPLKDLKKERQKIREILKAAYPKYVKK